MTVAKMVVLAVEDAHKDGGVGGGGKESGDGGLGSGGGRKWWCWQWRTAERDNGVRGGRIAAATNGSRLQKLLVF